MLRFTPLHGKYLPLETKTERLGSGLMISVQPVVLSTQLLCCDSGGGGGGHSPWFWVPTAKRTPRAVAVG